MGEALRLGELTAKDVHLCVDMQRLFAEQTEWHTPWMARILPNVSRIVQAHPSQTICTRFIPARNAEAVEGGWRRYYERWGSMTLDRVDHDLVELVPELRRVMPPVEVVDKATFSPWLDPLLDRRMRERGATSLVITGGETDVCVLATVLGAIDLGYRVVVVADALCSSADAIHDAAISLYSSRFGQQMELASTDDVLQQWRS